MPRRTESSPADPYRQHASSGPRHTAAAASQTHHGCGIGELPQDLLAEVLSKLQVTDWKQARGVDTSWGRVARQNDVVARVAANGVTRPVPEQGKKKPPKRSAAPAQSAPLPPFPNVAQPNAADRPDLHLIASSTYDRVLTRPPAQATFLGFAKGWKGWLSSGSVVPHGEFTSVHGHAYSTSLQLRLLKDPTDAHIADHLNDLLPECHIDTASILTTYDTSSNRYRWRRLDGVKLRGLVVRANLTLAGDQVRIRHPDGVSTYGLVEAREHVVLRHWVACESSVAHAGPNIVNAGHGLAVGLTGTHAQVIDFARPLLAGRTFEADPGMEFCAGRVLTDAKTMLTLSTNAPIAPSIGTLRHAVLQRWRIEDNAVVADTHTKLSGSNRCRALFSADGSRLLAIPRMSDNEPLEPGCAFDLTQTPPRALRLKVDRGDEPLAIADDGRRAIIGVMGHYAGTRLFMLDGSGRAAARSLDGGKPLMFARNISCLAESVSFTPTGTRVVAVDNRTMDAYIWDVTDPRPRLLTRLTLSKVRSLAFLTDWQLTGTMVDRDGRTRMMLWDYSSLPPRSVPEDAVAAVRAAEGR